MKKETKELRERVAKLELEKVRLFERIARFENKEQVKDAVADQLNLYAKTNLLKLVAATEIRMIFKMTSENPLKYPKFNEWYESLTRKQLLEYAPKELIAWTDMLTLQELKDYFRISARDIYIEEEQKHLDWCARMIKKGFKKEDLVG